MKEIYITIFTSLLAFSLVRYLTDAEPLTLRTLLLTLEEFPVNIKEDFKTVVKAFNDVVTVMENYGNIAGSGIDWIVQFLQAIGKFIASWFKFCVLFFKNAVLLLCSIFELLFGVDLSLLAPGSSTNNNPIKGPWMIVPDMYPSV